MWLVGEPVEPLASGASSCDVDHPFFGLPETHIVIVGIIISKNDGVAVYSCSRVVMIMVALMIIVRMVVESPQFSQGSSSCYVNRIFFFKMYEQDHLR